MHLGLHTCIQQTDKVEKKAGKVTAPASADGKGLIDTQPPRGGCCWKNSWKSSNLVSHNALYATQHAQAQSWFSCSRGHLTAVQRHTCM